MIFSDWSPRFRGEHEMKVLLTVTSWCELCDKQITELKKIEEEFRDVEFVLIDADERPDIAIRYTPQIYPSISVITDRGIIGGSYGLIESEKLRELISTSIYLLGGKGKLIKPPEVEKKLPAFSEEYVFRDILRRCEGYFDWISGGFEREPKFVSPEVLKLFLKFNDFYHQSMVSITLDNAIDYLWDNGFYLFSKSIDWKEPYKVKMSDFNASMVMILLDAYKTIKDDKYLDYAIKTGEFLKSMTRDDGLIMNGVAFDKVDTRPFMHVNALVLEAFYTLGDYEDYSERAKLLLELLSRSGNHRVDNPESPLYLFDIAHLLRALTLAREDSLTRKVSSILGHYYGGGGYYDVTLEFAEREGIGRFKFIYDNSVLAEALINLGRVDDARKIILDILPSYVYYSYFNQAQFALVLGEILGKFNN
ncbi:thioredoxin domain-containing protein [Stygiolobus caldivivus]|uniref:Thioredoxin domain-containing protein n=1 Tax=Stygiolobus caldivivus TaxID=2824673 RepID=A0A8D5U3Z3_9CREN|nr:thioredoxin domain-containing protein [Stygiolobus caldivivus]BCU68817.1 hypothetical protein KN1_01140 [Stygiolobus caldivivus]